MELETNRLRLLLPLSLLWNTKKFTPFHHFGSRLQSTKESSLLYYIERKDRSLWSIDRFSFFLSDSFQVPRNRFFEICVFLFLGGKKKSCFPSFGEVSQPLEEKRIHHVANWQFSPLYFLFYLAWDKCKSCIHPPSALTSGPVQPVGFLSAVFFGGA